MKVSIITPCRNAGQFIAETIESVISQRGDFELEYVIVDGASTDDTLEIAAAYRDSIASGGFTPRCNRVSMTVVSEPDSSMYDALVKGFSLVSGEVVAYLNADDIYFPNALSTVVAIFRDHADVDWLTGMCTVLNEAGQVTSTILPLAFSRDLIRSGAYGRVHINTIQQESTFWRASLLAAVDMEKLRRFKLAGDFYLWSCFAGQTGVWLVQSCLGGFRSHASQLSRQQEAYREEMAAVECPLNPMQRFRAYLQLLGTYFLPDRLKRRINRRILHFTAGRWS
jgi:glycosyltransferase involved in cell wall biosynthesis